MTSQVLVERRYRTCALSVDYSEATAADVVVVIADAAVVPVLQ
jgi:hypothetical protein